MLVVSAGCASQNSNIIAPTSTTVTTTDNNPTSTEIAYKNTEYGFSLEFPNTWKGYTTKNRILDWGTIGTSDSIDFGFSTQDSLFNIGMYSKSQWQKIKSEEGPTPTYLGENSQYIFGFAQANGALVNDIIVARMAEVKDIIKTFKIVN